MGVAAAAEQERYIVRRIQLAKSAAALMIQAAWVGFSTRRKYMRVLSFKASLKAVKERAHPDHSLPGVRHTWETEVRVVLYRKNCCIGIKYTANGQTNRICRRIFLGFVRLL
jgi:hypothetical protein